MRWQMSICQYRIAQAEVHADQKSEKDIDPKNLPSKDRPASEYVRISGQFFRYLTRHTWGDFRVFCDLKISRTHPYAIVLLPFL